MILIRMLKRMNGNFDSDCANANISEFAFRASMKETPEIAEAATLYMHSNPNGIVWIFVVECIHLRFKVSEPMR